MKKNTLAQRLIYTGAMLLICNAANAQQASTGAPVPPATTTAVQAGSAWYRGGNLNAHHALSNNIFGTMWNSPIYTYTDALPRMKLNGTWPGATQYAVNTYNGIVGPINTSGYFLLGPNGAVSSGNIYDANRGPFSLLHLNGTHPTIQEWGFRPWMKTGISFTSNNDFAYFGHKGNGADLTDFVCAWSDNMGSGNAGPDVMKFVFTTGVGNQNNDLTGDHMDGREIMRMTGWGNVGIGPRFLNTNQPQSQLHINSENNTNSYLQITNQGTGATYAPSDGLRIGVLGDANTGSYNGTALMYNQEARHLLFSTNFASPSSITATNERLRITAASNPTYYMHASTNFTPQVISPNPANLIGTNTRVGISLQPAIPVTRPLSLVHIGYNAGLLSTPIGSTDGWRQWMELGTFTSSGSDHVFVGLKPQPITSNNVLHNRWDAVIGWGDDQFTTQGPDNMLFVFTAGTGGTTPATTMAGVEAMRMTPDSNGVRVGIGGDPSTNLYYAANINPSITLEVNSHGAVTNTGGSSGMRFTDLTAASPFMTNPGAGVLSVDSTGKVVYVEANGGVGNYCGTPQDTLIGDYEVPLNAHNYYFSGTTQGNNTNSVAFGLNCSTPLQGKIHVEQRTVTTTTANTNGGYFVNRDLGSNISGVKSWIPNNSIPGIYYGGDFLAEGNSRNKGIRAQALSFNAQNTGGEFLAQNGPSSNIGVLTTAIGNSTTQNNIGVNAGAQGPTAANGYNIGVYGTATGGTTNYAIYGFAQNTAPQNYAGYFVGDVQFNGNVLGSQFGWTSDAMFKTNIDTITDPLATLQQLQPKTYYYDTLNQYDMRFSNAKQYGFIAQDVEQVLPSLVSTTTKPAEYDSIGNVLVPSVTYKNLNYIGMISVLTAGMQKQQELIENQQQTIQSQQSRMDSIINVLAALSAQVNGCCNNGNNGNGNGNGNGDGDARMMDVTLGGDAIVLEQNVPNPFADQTVINYFIPENAGFAQIIFYNSLGQIIRTVDITEKGKGSLNVFASNLATGMYSYTLVVDGKNVDTKKMVKH